MARPNKQTSAAMYRCRELRESIDFLGAGLGPLGGRDLECPEIHAAKREISQQILVLNELRERIARAFGFLAEMETPEIVKGLQA